MSNHLISLAYTRDLRTSMRKAMLVLMADKASDDGSGIWAAKQTMADELCCSKQTVIDTIKGFIAEGLVNECGQRKSPNGYTVEYRLNVEAMEALALVKCHADKGSRKLTGQPAGPVKDADRTSQPTGPKPSRTHLSSEAKASKPPKPKFILPADMPAEPFEGFVAMRKAIRKPMNDHAKHLAVLRLRKLRDEDGWPPGEVLNHCTLNSYQGIYPPKDRQNGHGNQPPGLGKSAATWAMLDQSDAPF